MGRSIQWDGDAWEDYCEWQKDKATLKRINALIKDIRRDLFAGIGIGDIIVILACKGHYD